MGNRSSVSKESILADVKELIYHLVPVVQRMPKIDRIEGPGYELKRASYDIVELFYIAYHCEEERSLYIKKMIGAYGRLLVAFEMALRQGLVLESKKLVIAERIEKIEAGISRWRRHVKISNRQIVE